MKRPRFIYYNDAHHYHAKRLEPPTSRHLLQWPVDEVSGTSVDTLVLGLGYSDVYFHRSKVGRVVGQGKQTWDSWIDWRILRMVEEAERLGTDQLQVCIEAGRQAGVRVVPSLKLQDVSPPDDERAGRLKIERGADLCIGEEGRYLWGYDWAHEEVAEAKLAIVREVLDDYDADGIELDFMFDLRYFRAGQVDAGRQAMTRFVDAVRQIARAAADRRGVDVPVTARVAVDRQANVDAGLDVEGWLAAGLLDWVVGQDERGLTDSQPKPAWLPAAAGAAGAHAYYRPPRRVYHEATIFPHIEMYRALQHTLVEGGWAGLYHGYLPWPFGDAEHDLLREAGFPEVTVRRDKRYFLQPREGDPAGETTTPDRQLPVALEEGTRVVLALHVADDVEAARADGEMRPATLTLRLQNYCSEDTLRLAFNGAPLALADADMTDERALAMPLPASAGPIQAPLGGAFHWLRFAIPAERVRRGENVVEVVLERTEPRATFARALNGVELRLRYRDMQRPLGLEHERISPRLV